MDKETPSNYPIHLLLEKRWSPRSFKDRAVEKEKLQSIFEAARWSASCFNEQPWRYIVGTAGCPAYKKLLSVLSDWNRQWAQTAPALILLCKRASFTKTGKPNAWADYDVGQSAAYMSLQATHEGLYVHQMAGFDKEKAQHVFKIPEGFQPLTMMALGYIDGPEKLPAELREREQEPRIRHSIKDFVFEDEWGSESGLF